MFHASLNRVCTKGFAVLNLKSIIGEVKEKEEVASQCERDLVRLVGAEDLI